MSRQALGRHGVGGFARLSDRNCEFLGADGRIAILKFARVVHIRKYVDQFLKHVLPGHSRVTTGPGSNNVDATHGSQFCRADPDFIPDTHLNVLQRDAGSDGVLKRLRLLKDFLEHEVGKFILIGHLSSRLLYS